MRKKGITIFARVNHAEALIFGNPTLGTPLMQVRPEIGIDLPLRALAWRDNTGRVWLGYSVPDTLRRGYGVGGHDAVFDRMTAAPDKLTDAAVKPE